MLAVSVAAVFSCAKPAFSAGNAKDLVRDALLQQSPAQRTGCDGVQRTIRDGADATLVVRTAVELGFNSCQVIRCALENKVSAEMEIHCDKVIRGAILAGVQPDVISRCSAEFCDPAAVAALLGNAFLDTNYCYFVNQQPVAPDILPPQFPIVDRSRPQSQASPFRF